MSNQEIKATEWDNVTEPYTDIHRYNTLTEEPYELIASCTTEEYADFILSQQTLIDQQAKEIERLRKDNSDFMSNCHAAMKDAKHQKAITELAVKALEEAKERFDDFRRNWDCDSDAHKYNTPCRVCESEKSRDLINYTLQEIRRNTNA